MKKLLTALTLSSAITVSVHAQRPQTDRENEGLKGPVKSVLTETARLKKQGGRYVEEGRAAVKRATYNAEGNFAETESYADDGTAEMKKVYRYVGGEKIADGQFNVPVMRSVPRAGGTAPPARAPEPRPARRTLRSSEKYKYKYDDQGRVTEMTIEENGQPTTKIAYEYRGDRKETRWYAIFANADGDHLTSREVDKFDARGNLVETTNFHATGGSVLHTYSYTAYEFDAQGNWVKRLRSELRRWEPEVRRVEYRTIIYF